MIYEALSGSFREVKFKQNPRCPLCGENPSITELVEYPLECGIPQNVLTEKRGQSPVSPRAKQD
jgi:adenylyltransferase/sulfurtransferase